jgi:hypothetical protein
MRHGEHGFFFRREDELVEACALAGDLDRAACRRWALERFCIGRMVDDYEDVYREVSGAIDARSGVSVPA